MIRRTRAGVLAILAIPVLALAACTDAVNKQPTDNTSAPGGSGKYGYKIAVVTHGGAGDAFWSIVKNGVQKAGKDMGDSVSYQSDGDPTKQSQLIDAAVNAKPDGLVVSMANPEALKAAIQRAVKAGIPVITINSGEAQSK